jgi:tRNA(adenine34) deaminase
MTPSDLPLSGSTERALAPSPAKDAPADAAREAAVRESDAARAARDASLIGEALDEARAAARGGEVPVGAVVWHDGRIVGRGFNRPISANDPTAHAEIVAIRRAAEAIGNYRLTGAVLAVTLEPCLMCFGAALAARIEGVVFGAPDPRLGAAERTLRLQQESGVLNHRIGITSGVRESECAALLRDFFAARR